MLDRKNMLLLATSSKTKQAENSYFIDKDLLRGGVKPPSRDTPLVLSRSLTCAGLERPICRTTLVIKTCYIDKEQ